MSRVTARYPRGVSDRVADVESGTARRRLGEASVGRLATVARGVRMSSRAASCCGVTWSTPRWMASRSRATLRRIENLEANAASRCSSTTTTTTGRASGGCVSTGAVASSAMMAKRAKRFACSPASTPSTVTLRSWDPCSHSTSGPGRPGPEAAVAISRYPSAVAAMNSTTTPASSGRGPPGGSDPRRRRAGAPGPPHRGSGTGVRFRPPG